MFCVNRNSIDILVSERDLGHFEALPVASVFSSIALEVSGGQMLAG